MSRNIHSDAQKGFSRSGNLYDGGRADYPHTAISQLLQGLNVSESSKVLELAAGTGKFTKQILPYVQNIIAVEPVYEMRKKFSKQLPDIQIVDGTAEKIPFADSTFDFVFVATAFHWFDYEKAIQEIHRVLKPKGGLGLIWNTWSKDIIPPWLKEIREVIEPYSKKAPRYKSMQWREAFYKTTLFTPLEERVYGHPVRLDINGVCNRMLSISFIAALPEEQFKEVERQLRTILKKHKTPQDYFEMPYQTDIFWCRKIY